MSPDDPMLSDRRSIDETKTKRVANAVKASRIGAVEREKLPSYSLLNYPVITVRRVINKLTNESS